VTAVFDLTNPAERTSGITAGREAISASSLVVMPTDTVYGIAGDAFTPTAVRRLLRAKGRGRNMPVPVLINSADTIRALATNIGENARDLAEAFWPGGLTLILRQQPSLQWDIGDSRGTVALRVPDHEDAILFLTATGPLAVSSANTTGSPPAVTVAETQEMLGERVEVYLDAGPTAGAVPSTIVDATGGALRVVRIGVISLAQLREVDPDIEAPHDPYADGDGDGDGDGNGNGYVDPADEPVEEPVADESGEDTSECVDEDPADQTPADAPAEDDATGHG
jgi:L-threonylcarbamoyladenylate synthase